VAVLSYIGRFLQLLWYQGPQEKDSGARKARGSLGTETKNGMKKKENGLWGLFFCIHCCLLV
jgi:hypothetical protein